MAFVAAVAAALQSPLPPGISGQKMHTSTVAIVPPEACWPPIQSARLDLRDKGLFRWPPHINLLYPYVPEEEFIAAAPLLTDALASVGDFDITLDSLGTFGGRSRGVLYLCSTSVAEEQALQSLQRTLQDALPFCSEQQKQGRFVPHMTISHFRSRDEAEGAKEDLLRSWQPLSFRTADCIHMMRRLGGSGQFERSCTLRLGGGTASSPPLLFEPPRRFESMPVEEEGWMRLARKDSYKRGGGSAGRRKTRRPRRTPEERAAILARTPEDIAAIRAERAAKRARLEAEEDVA